MSKKTILIFDSDLSFLELLEVIFEESDYKILSSDSSHDTIQQIDFHKPAIVIIDTWMSGDNAMIITSNIRQDLYFNSIPIILMGTNVKLDALQHTAGADDFISKPFDIDGLEQKLTIYSH